MPVFPLRIWKTWAGGYELFGISLGVSLVGMMSPAIRSVGIKHDHDLYWSFSLPLIPSRPAFPYHQAVGPSLKLIRKGGQGRDVLTSPASDEVRRCPPEGETVPRQCGVMVWGYRLKGRVLLIASVSLTAFLAVCFANSPLRTATTG